MNVEEVSSVVVDTAFHHHQDLGPGLHQVGSEQTSAIPALLYCFHPSHLKLYHRPLLIYSVM